MLYVAAYTEAQRPVNDRKECGVTMTGLVLQCDISDAYDSGSGAAQWSCSVVQAFGGMYAHVATSK